MDEQANKLLINILNDYDTIERDPAKIAVFRAFSKVHELKTSGKEFGELQKRIKSNESSEYIQEKSYLRSSLITLKEQKPRPSI